MKEEDARALQKRLLQFISQMPDAPESLWRCGSPDFIDQLMADPQLGVTANNAIATKLEETRLEGEKQKRKAKLRRRGIPDILWPPLMGEKPMDENEAVKYVRKWWEDGDPSDWVLVLAGKNGPGKSQAAAWLIHSIEQEPDEEFVPKFLTLKEQYEYSLYDGGADYLYEAPLLCIDEVGSAYPDRQEFTKMKLVTLLMTRYDRKLPTIITSNLPCNPRNNKLAAFLGNSVWDRILEHTPQSIFEVTEASRRSGR